MKSLEITQAAARLLIEFGDAESAERAAGARIQTACNAGERAFWGAVRTLLAADEEEARGAQAEVLRRS